MKRTALDYINGIINDGESFPKMRNESNICDMLFSLDTAIKALQSEKDAMRDFLGDRLGDSTTKTFKGEEHTARIDRTTKTGKVIDSTMTEAEKEEYTRLKARLKELDAKNIYEKTAGFRLVVK